MTTVLRSYCVQSETAGFSSSWLWFKGLFLSIDYDVDIFPCGKFSLFFGRLGGVLSHLKKAYSGECGIAQFECSPRRKKVFFLFLLF